MSNKNYIVKIISEIIQYSEAVITKYIDEELVIDYVDIFPISEKERLKLLREADTIGKRISLINTGPIYLLNHSIQTKFGPLKLIKIRIYDKEKKQRGAPDFKVKDYTKFKNKYLTKKFFSLIVRKEYEMLELNVRNSRVLIYFPNETQSESMNL